MTDVLKSKYERSVSNSSALHFRGQEDHKTMNIFFFLILGHSAFLSDLQDRKHNTHLHALLCISGNFVYEYLCV